MSFLPGEKLKLRTKIEERTFGYSRVPLVGVSSRWKKGPGREIQVADVRRDAAVGDGRRIGAGPT